MKGAFDDLWNIEQASKIKTTEYLRNMIVSLEKFQKLTPFGFINPLILGFRTYLVALTV